jgi:hypothetical protein
MPVQEDVMFLDDFGRTLKVTPTNNEGSVMRVKIFSETVIDLAVVSHLSQSGKYLDMQVGEWVSVCVCVWVGE